MSNTKQPACSFVDAFRHSAPYIHAHRGRTIVIGFGGEAVADPSFGDLITDIALLQGLGIRLVLVHGARPQIEQRLRKAKAEVQYANGLRVTDDAALACVKDAVGSLRVEIEALLSMGLANTPMAGARIRVASGNFVTARPLGVRDGIDFCHTGEVRRVDGTSLREELEASRIVLLSPLGYSPTGEVFNLSAEEVATAAAVELKADKLVLLIEGKGLRDTRKRLLRQLNPAGAAAILNSRRKLPDDMQRHLHHAVQASRRGVRRTHLISRTSDGALLQELFTRDGIGTLITSETYEGLRQANIDDVGGILELIAPLEEEGILMRRSRELLEMEIDHFIVIERDGMIVACAALYGYPEEKLGELACMAVHKDYRGDGRGDTVLGAVEQRARSQGLDELFVLTTRTAHWFRERGFAPSDIGDLPLRKRDLYNYQRKSKIFRKRLD